MGNALQKAEREIGRAVIESSPCPTLAVDAGGLVVFANRAAGELFGMDPRAMAGQSIEAFLPEEMRARHAVHRAQFGESPTPRPMGRRRDLHARRSDGTVFPVEVGLSPVRTPDGAFVVCAVVDLTERRQAEHRLREQAAELARANQRLGELASTDSLTALWNRRAFLEQLDIRLEQAVRSARPLSVLLMDVDHFKPYNDEFGHLAGDEILQRAARLLRERARRSDFLARIGGEEFGVILHEADRMGAVKLAEHLRTAVEAATWPRRRITVSVGVATVRFPSAVPRPPSPGRSQVLSLADQALYHSKEQGRNRVTHVEDLKAAH